MSENPDSLRPVSSKGSLHPWVLATMAGFTAAHFALDSVVEHLGPLKPAIHQAIAGGVAGILIGGLQGWFFYKNRHPLWKAWAAGSILGWMAGYLLQAWALGIAASPILEHFGSGIGTLLLGQALMGASCGLPIVAVQAYVLVRFLPKSEVKVWSLQAWGSFVLAGVMYAFFVRFFRAALPGLAWNSGNAVLLALGWSLKGAIIGVMTGRPLFPSPIQSVSPEK